METLTRKLIGKAVFAFIMLLSVAAFSQDGTASKDEAVYDIKGLETPPEYPGGTIELYKHVGRNFKVPSGLKSKGRIYTTFIIEKDGSVTHPEVLKNNLEEAYQTEAIRVINTLKKWKPGQQNGVPVRTKFTLPITVQS